MSEEYRCETVKIVDGDGFKIINKSDFDPATQKIFGAPEPVVETPVAVDPVKTDAKPGKK